MGCGYESKNDNDVPVALLTVKKANTFASESTKIVQAFVSTSFQTGMFRSRRQYSSLKALERSNMIVEARLRW